MLFNFLINERQPLKFIEAKTVVNRLLFQLVNNLTNNIAILGLL